MTQHGFFNETTGVYWQADGPIPDYVKLRHKQNGTVEVPLMPSGDHEWDGSKWVAVAPDPEEVRAAQIDAINAERDRRLAADFTFQGKAYQRDAVSVSRIAGVATLAGFAMAQGAKPDDYNWHGGDAPFAWIASDNSMTLMDAQTCFAFGSACAAIETRIVFAAKALRTMEPIPDDYAKDKHWP